MPCHDNQLLPQGFGASRLSCFLPEAIFREVRFTNA